MKLIPLLIGAIIALSPLTSRADELLYGNCKKVPDKYSDCTFYKCLSVDQQIVYTNILPSKEAQQKFLKEYVRREKLRKQKQAQKHSDVVTVAPVTVHLPDPDTISDEQTPEELAKDLKEALKEAVPAEPASKVDPCYEKWVQAKKDMQKLGDLLLQWKGVRGDATDKEIDMLTIRLGEYIGSDCNI